MKAEKITFKIITEDCGIIEITGEKIKFDNLPSHTFAIHKSIGDKGKRINDLWSISHIESMAMVCGYLPFKDWTLQEAEKLLKKYTDISFTAFTNEMLKNYYNSKNHSKIQPQEA